MKQKLRNWLKLCLVTNCKKDVPFKQYVNNIVIPAINGGVTMVQLREKNTDIQEFLYRAKELKRVLNDSDIPLIINDNVQIAKEIDADGVHLGQTDMHPDLARKILGPNKIIGLSIESLEELEDSNTLSSINYKTASAIFPSKTKTDYKKIWGINGLAEMVKLSERSEHLVTAIGGINHDNARSIIAAGAVGIAVIGAIQSALDPYQATLALRKIMEKQQIHKLMLKQI